MDSTLLMLAWAQLWQVTLLVVVVAVLVRMVASNRPHLAYALWLVVLVKCVTPPVWASPSGVFCWLQPVDQIVVGEAAVLDGSAAMASVPVADDVIVPLFPVEAMPVAVSEFSATPEPASTRFTWWGVVAIALILWALGAAVSFALSLWRWRASLCTAGRRERDGEFEEHVATLAVRLGLRKRIRTVVTKGQLGPAVTGVFRPMLLMPEGMLAGKTIAELEPILVHELIHVRRGDLWVGILQTVVLALWWFHPLVRWVVRESMGEAERCCDEAVLAELGCRPKEYARSLLDVLQYKTEWAPAPAFPGAGRVDATAKRLERIMRLGQGSRRRSPWWCWVVMVAVAVVVLPGGAFVVSGEKGDQVETSSGASDSPSTGGQVSGAVSVVSPAESNDDNGEADRLWITYAAADVLDEIERTTGSRDEAKTELMELCGFEADRQGPHAPGSRLVWMDETLVAVATDAEHDTIRAELEAIREHGLCSLEIKVLCVQGPAAEIEAIVESEGPLAEQLLKEEEEREATTVKLTCKSVVFHGDFERIMGKSKGNAKVRILASPRLRVETGQTATVGIGEEIPFGAEATEESGAACHIWVGLGMQFQPRLRAGNKVLLHSDVTLSEAERVGARNHSKGSFWRGSGIRVSSRKASSTTLGALGDTVAIRTRGPVDGEGDSEPVLLLVHVQKVARDGQAAEAGAGAWQAWDLLGLQLEAIDQETFQREFSTRYRGGLRVAKVRSGSPATGRVQVGDVLVGLHIWETISLKNVKYVLDRPDLKEFFPLKFYVIRDGEISYGHFPEADELAARVREHGKDSLLVMTYDVADLVVRMPGTVCVSLGAKQPRVASLDATSDFDELISLLTTTIAPETWEDVGGPGTVAPFEANRSLVIRQTREVHEEIVDWLAEIRRRRGFQIVVRSRWMMVSDRFCNANWPEIGETPKAVVMSSSKAGELLEAVRDADRTDGAQPTAGKLILEGPKATLFSGQQLRAVVPTVTTLLRQDYATQLSFVIAEDKKSVWVNGMSWSGSQAPTNVHSQVKNGETLVVEVPGTLAGSESSSRGFLFLTPAIVQQEEERAL